MEITQVSTDITTAVTDYILCACLLFMAVKLSSTAKNRSGADNLKKMLWMSTFLSFGVAALIGGSLKLMVLTEEQTASVNPFLFFAVATGVGCFALGAIHDKWGVKWSTRLVIPVLVGAYVCLSSKPAFLLFYLSAMLLSLVVYSVLAYKKETGAAVMSLGVATVILAAVVRSQGPFEFEFIWQFNQGGVFHLMQLIGMFLLYISLVSSFKVPDQWAQNT